MNDYSGSVTDPDTEDRRRIVLPYGPDGISTYQELAAYQGEPAVKRRPGD